MPADFKVEGASLALVVDVTGSMGPEIGDIKTGLNTMISGLESLGVQFPKTAIVTFDDRATIRAVSRDPERLRTVINGLTTHSTPDCPEGANAALMTAGRLLGSGGRAILVTDADSHPTGPSREDVDESYRAKGARLSVLLSGTCTPPPASAARVRAAAAPAFGGTVGAPGPGPDEARPVDALGVEDSVRTFSEESLFSGGLFSFQPEVKSGTADVHARYANTLANVGISAVTPAVAALSPSAVPQGTSLAVELTGSKTGFRAGSAVAVGGSGVSVDSVDVVGPTRLVVRLTVARLRIGPDAPLGFRDVKVTTRAEQAALLDGFEVLPAAVQAPPAAPPAPGSPPGSATCTDRTPPSATLRRVTVSRGRLRVSGRARDAGCGAAVARVEVAISRAAKRRKCRFVDARGRLTQARSCARPVLLKATGTASWSLATKRKLPRGTYAIQARAVDAAGNVQARPAKRTQRVR